MKSDPHKEVSAEEFVQRCKEAYPKVEERRFKKGTVVSVSKVGCPDWDTFVQEDNFLQKINRESTYRFKQYDPIHGIVDEECTLQKEAKWEPTEQEYRECCGGWLLSSRPDQIIKVLPTTLSAYSSRQEFDTIFSGNERVEPIPEQCVPKPEVERERYEWAGIIEGWMI